MPNPTTSLYFSRKLFEIIGEQETQCQYQVDRDKSTYKNIVMTVHDPAECSDEHGCQHDIFHRQSKKINDDIRVNPIPAYTLGELLRVIPLIAEKKGWGEGVDLHTVAAISFAFVSPTTPEQGMREVEAYLMTML